MGEYEQLKIKSKDGSIVFQKKLADYYLTKLKRPDDALEIYDRVLKIVPEDLEALFAVAYIAESMEQFENARVLYHRILEIEPGNKKADEKIDKLLRNENSG